MAIPSPMIFLRSVCSAMNEKSRKIFSTLMSMQRLHFYIDSDFDIDIGKGFQKYIIMKVYHLHLSMSSEFAKIAKNILF